MQKKWLAFAAGPATGALLLAGALSSGFAGGSSPEPVEEPTLTRPWLAGNVLEVVGSDGLKVDADGREVLLRIEQATVFDCATDCLQGILWGDAGNPIAAGRAVCVYHNGMPATKIWLDRPACP